MQPQQIQDDKCNFYKHFSFYQFLLEYTVEAAYYDHFGTRAF